MQLWRKGKLQTFIVSVAKVGSVIWQQHDAVAGYANERYQVAGVNRIFSVQPCSPSFQPSCPVNVIPHRRQASYLVGQR